MLCCAVLCCAVLCCAVRCGAVRCGAVRCFALQLAAHQAKHRATMVQQGPATRIVASFPYEHCSTRTQGDWQASSHRPIQDNAGQGCRIRGAFQRSVLSLARPVIREQLIDVRIDDPLHLTYERSFIDNDSASLLSMSPLV